MHCGGDGRGQEHQVRLTRNRDLVRHTAVSTYVKHKCRCGPCTQAFRDNRSERRVRTMARKGKVTKRRCRGTWLDVPGRGPRRRSADGRRTDHGVLGTGHRRRPRIASGPSSTSWPTTDLSMRSSCPLGQPSSMMGKAAPEVSSFRPPTHEQRIGVQVEFGLSTDATSWRGSVDLTADLGC